MWMTIISFLGGPVVKGLIDAYKVHVAAATTDKQTAMNLAAKQIAGETADNQGNIQLRIAQIGHPWEPEKLAMYVTLVYYTKCLIWDKVLALGTTDPVGGAVAIWAGMIMGFYFTKRGAENVTTIIKAFK